MKLYTGQGDDGTTRLINGQRVAKHHGRVAAYGHVDEVNAAIGLAASWCDDQSMLSTLQTLQSQLFELGTELATPADSTPKIVISKKHVVQLERWIDQAYDETPPLKSFILPGGTRLASALHLARTICRRAERSVTGLGQIEAVSPIVTVYLNRLSDLLFAMARLVNHRAGQQDIPWIAPTTNESTP